jgi:RNA polymerase sigma-70 factor, ECF subfamily
MTDHDDGNRELAELQPRLHRFARWFVRDRIEAEDLVQETCARALAARKSFTPGTNYSAWLFTILRNLALNRRRQLATRPPVLALDDVTEDELGADPTSDVERDVLARAELSEVMQAFEALPAMFAEPLRLAVIQERSYAQVAAELSIPIGTVMSRVYRARQLMIKRLGAAAEAGPLSSPPSTGRSSGSPGDQGTHHLRGHKVRRGPLNHAGN